MNIRALIKIADGEAAKETLRGFAEGMGERAKSLEDQARTDKALGWGLGSAGIGGGGYLLGTGWHGLSKETQRAIAAAIGENAVPGSGAYDPAAYRGKGVDPKRVGDVVNRAASTVTKPPVDKIDMYGNPRIETGTHANSHNWWEKKPSGFTIPEDKMPWETPTEASAGKYTATEGGPLVERKAPVDPKSLENRNVVAKNKARMVGGGASTILGTWMLGKYLRAAAEGMRQAGRANEAKSDALRAANAE